MSSLNTNDLPNPGPSDPPVLLIRHDGWAEIVFNRPHRKNAIQGPLAQAFLQALNDAEADDSLRALVLRGAGGTFCSGLDLQEFNADPNPGWVRLGMAAPNNLAWILLRHSEAVAARLALMGDRVGANELLRLGVVTEVVADDQVVTRCTALAQEMGQWPMKGVTAIKPAIRSASLGMSVDAWFSSFGSVAAPNPPSLSAKRSPS